MTTDPTSATRNRTGPGMSPGAGVRPEVTDDRGLARARERFLAAEPVEPGQVRETILASWRRSRECGVAADRLDLSYVGDPDLDTPLTRTALPVLQNLHQNLQGQPVSVILTDAHGVALSRLTADHDLERHLDRVQLAPGFSYAEKFAGTNGIGTALESGRAAHVFGHEHYAEHLEGLACAAVPIRHPVSGLIIGAVGLTCWRRDASRLLIALAQSTASQVTQGLLDDSRAGEFQLLREYLRACRHTGGFVFALARDMEPDHWACPGRRSTGRSTSTGSSPRPADRTCAARIGIQLRTAACLRRRLSLPPPCHWRQERAFIADLPGQCAGGPVVAEVGSRLGDGEASRRPRPTGPSAPGGGVASRCGQPGCGGTPVAVTPRGGFRSLVVRPPAPLRAR